jgi:hypothetical protein
MMVLRTRSNQGESMSVTAPPEQVDPPVEPEPASSPAPAGLIVLDTEDAPVCADGNCW